MKVRVLYTIFCLTCLTLCLREAAAFRLEPMMGNNTTEIENARLSITQSLISARNGSEDLISSLLADDGNETKYQVLSNLRTKFPLLKNELLNEAAEAICAANVTGAMPSVDNNVTTEYLNNLGYLAESIHVDKTGLIMQEYMDPTQAAQLLITSYLQSNLEMADNGSALFDDQYLEVGVGYCGGMARLHGMKPANVYMMVILLARPAEPQPYWLQCGHVFYDTNNNYVFEHGEGLRGVRMMDDNGTLLAVTLDDGQYCFKRPIGEWTLLIENYPYREDYSILNVLVAQRQGGVLYQDFPVDLTQEQIDQLQQQENETY